jgi:SAM-dependent methyltransferase
MRCNDTINVDITPAPGIDQVVDLSKFPWPWKDNSVDGILASHVLEHIEDQKGFLLECHRLLKKDAILTLILPHSSSVIANGCLGHYRTYSFNTISDYLCRDFYMFGEAKFEEVSNCLTWWNSDIWYIKLLNNIISPLIRLHPQIFENIWCYWVGGAKEFGWKGRKI